MTRATAKLPDKSAVRAALVTSLEHALETVVHAAAQAREGATHSENRAEGDKDMRSTEQSYLARGQAMRVEEIAEQLQRLAATPPRVFAPGDAIAPGALVLVRVDDDPRVFFVMVQGGGTELVVGDAKVTVVTPASPVGTALVGRRVGEDFELALRGTLREWVIEEIV